MSLHLERIEWMSSPPLAPDDGPIDFAHLGRITLGDTGLEHEVLAMFSAQSAHLIDAIAALPEDVRALAHTLKGSARAIGAFAVADAATGPRKGRRSVGAARRPRQGGFAGTDGDRGASAPFLNPISDRSGQNSRRNRPAGFPPGR